jgi:hypothetical protein
MRAAIRCSLFAIRLQDSIPGWEVGSIRRAKRNAATEGRCELCRPSTAPTSAKAALVGDPATGLGSIFNFTQHSAFGSVLG